MRAMTQRDTSLLARTGASTEVSGLDSSAAHLDIIVEMMREISRQSDPQEMIKIFRRRTTMLYGGEHSVSLSRRGLEPPQYRITRSSLWEHDINPWKEPHRLPVLEGGLLGELLYGDQPRVLRDICVPGTDPAFEYLKNVRSVVALPLFDGGVGLNMVVRLSSDPAGFDHINIGDALLTANLFGRATNSLVVAQQLKAAYAELDYEMRRVAEIQLSLLPPRLPKIPGVDIAASYQTAARAGGDYYDFFDLGDGRWGVLIADVSGHGTPAAVVMAMLRTILHAQCCPQATPGQVLGRANAQLCNHYDRFSGTFVTAFYGILDPRDRSMAYSCAGHNPPLLVDHKTNVRELNQALTYPLAIEPNTPFAESSVALSHGDTLLLYTDGITEAANPEGEMYGRERLLSCVHEKVPNAQHIIDCVTMKLLGFTGGGNQMDDQTLLALRLR
jgi:phosphoserine phosphatase RsbU/P